MILIFLYSNALHTSHGTSQSRSRTRSKNASHCAARSRSLSFFSFEARRWWPNHCIAFLFYGLEAHWRWSRHGRSFIPWVLENSRWRSGRHRGSFIRAWAIDNSDWWRWSRHCRPFLIAFAVVFREGPRRIARHGRPFFFWLEGRWGYPNPFIRWQGTISLVDPQWFPRDWEIGPGRSERSLFAGVIGGGGFRHRRGLNMYGETDNDCRDERRDYSGTESEWMWEVRRDKRKRRCGTLYS